MPVIDSTGTEIFIKIFEDIVATSTLCPEGPLIGSVGLDVRILYVIEWTRTCKVNNVGPDSFSLLLAFRTSNAILPSSRSFKTATQHNSENLYLSFLL